MLVSRECANVPTLFGPQVTTREEEAFRSRETRFSSAPMSVIQTVGPNTPAQVIETRPVPSTIHSSEIQPSKQRFCSASLQGSAGRQVTQMVLLTR